MHRWAHDSAANGVETHAAACGENRYTPAKGSADSVEVVAWSAARLPVFVIHMCVMVESASTSDVLPVSVPAKRSQLHKYASKAEEQEA